MRRGWYGGTRVAIKEAAASTAADSKTKLRAEARALQSMRHQHIVLFYGVAKEQDTLYLVTDLKKTDLQNYIETSSRQPSHTEVVRMALEVSSALEHLHSCDMAHSDVQPAHILVDSNDTLFLCGFGLSESLADDMEVFEANLYTAPEISAIRDKAVSLSRVRSTNNSRKRMISEYIETPQMGYKHPNKMSTASVVSKVAALDQYAFGVVLWVLLAWQLPPAESQQRPDKHASDVATADSSLPLEAISKQWPAATLALLLSLWAADPGSRSSIHEAGKYLRRLQDTLQSQQPAASQHEANHLRTQRERMMSQSALAATQQERIQTLEMSARTGNPLKLAHMLYGMKVQTLAPVVPLSERVFAKSNYKTFLAAALDAQVPQRAAQLLFAVEKLVERFESDKTVLQQFFARMNTEVFKYSKALRDKIHQAAEYLWTSPNCVQGRELCTLINTAIRRDDPEDLVHAIVIVAGINKLHRYAVTREGVVSPARGLHRYPAQGVCWRGTGFDDSCRAFFKKGA